MESSPTGAGKDQPANEAAISAWSGPRSRDYILETARSSGLRFLSAGSDDESTARHLSEELQLESYDDALRGPADCGASALLCGDPHLDILPHVRAGRTVCSLEPLAPRTHHDDRPANIGGFPGSRGFRAAEQIIPDFGAIASVHMISHCGPGQGSLGARLHDAMSTFHRLLGTAELVDGMLVGANDAQSHAPALSHVDATPERIGDLTGDIGVMARFLPRAVGTISASDQSAWLRELHVVGARGMLRIDDAGVTWIDPTGAVIEQGQGEEDCFRLAADQAGSDLKECLAGNWASVDPVDIAAVDVACEAVRLSCRTRAPESVQLLREVMERT